jgi:hypothetical protein
MLLVVQHVATGLGEGINAFYHAHGPRPDWVWEPPAGIPDDDPGEIVNQLVQIEGQGRVRAFLDIAAPDGTMAHQLNWAHNAIVALAGVGAQFPIIVLSGPIFIRYDLEFRLRQDWHRHLHDLLNVGLPLVPPA